MRLFRNRTMSGCGGAGGIPSLPVDLEGRDSMARTWIPLALASALLLQVPAAGQEAEGSGEAPALALVGATLVDGTGRAPVEGAVVVVRGSAIECAGAALDCVIPPGARVLDVRGKWLIPGLVDAHVHYSQTGFADGRPDALDLRDRFPYDSTVAVNRLDAWRYHRAYLCSGVTAVFDVGGFPWTWSLRDGASGTAAPHIAAAGPLLSTADHWLNLPGERQFIHIPTDSAVEAGARYVALNRSDALKVWFLHGESSDDPAGWERRVLLAGALADGLGLPLIVHATGLWQAKVAVRAGAKLLVHSVYQDRVDDEFLELARAAGTIYTPTLVVHEGYAQLSARDFDADAYGEELACVDPYTRAKAFLTDSLPGGASAEQLERIRAVGERRSALMAENLRRVKAAGIPIAMGTDAGNPLTLAGPSVFLEMEAMQAAGMTPMEVLVAATRTGAAAMGWGDQIGTVEEGKLGDLVVLDADPTADIRNAREVALVVRAGLVLDRANLKWD